MKTRSLFAALALVLIVALAYSLYRLAGQADTTSAAGNAGDGPRPGASTGASVDGQRPSASAAAAGGGSARGGGGRGAREALVITRPVGEGVTGDRLVSLGDGEAIASVDVVPRDSGVLVEVSVASGDRVALDDVLARLDDAAEVIRRDIAARAVDDATRNRSRLARLLRSQAGTQAELDAADNALARAELDLADAELSLARRTIRAPIAGRVGLVNVQPGDRVGVDTSIATIDDRTTLRVDFRVPERFASRVQVGQPIEATSFAAPGRTLTGEITAIGGRVASASRTLPVQAAIDNADDRLRPGMSFQVTLAFDGETLPSIDPLALQWDSRGSFVWAVRDNKAERVAARIVQRNAESVLIRGELDPGEPVVVEGVLSLRPGGAVRIAGAGDGARGGARNGARDGARGAGGDAEGGGDSRGGDGTRGGRAAGEDGATRRDGAARPSAAGTANSGS